MALILIADDEPALLKVLKLNIELEGHETILASDGETAVKRIETEHPDLVLLDVMMPVLDGWEVLRRISDMDAKSRPRVVVMTAKSGDRDMEQGRDLGAERYVTKPFEIDDLLKVITELLEDR